MGMVARAHRVRGLRDLPPVLAELIQPGIVLALVSQVGAVHPQDASAVLLRWPVRPFFLGALLGLEQVQRLHKAGQTVVLGVGPEPGLGVGREARRPNQPPPPTEVVQDKTEGVPIAVEEGSTT